MSVYHYADSSQVALRFDRVDHGLHGKGELVTIWLDNGEAERNKIQAEVAFDSGDTLSVPLRTLTYIPPEREVVERYEAQMAQISEAADLAVEARLGAEEGWRYQVRLDALQAALAYARVDNRIASPDDVLKVAETFGAYLWPSGQAPADGLVDG